VVEFFLVFQFVSPLLQIQNFHIDHKSVFETANKYLIDCKTEYDFTTRECQRYQLLVFISSIM